MLGFQPGSHSFCFLWTLNINYFDYVERTCNLIVFEILAFVNIARRRITEWLRLIAMQQQSIWVRPKLFEAGCLTPGDLWNHLEIKAGHPDVEAITGSTSDQLVVATGCNQAKIQCSHQATTNNFPSIPKVSLKDQSRDHLDFFYTSKIFSQNVTNLVHSATVSY